MSDKKMHSKHSVIKQVLLGAALLYATNIYALGLGEINVSSYLGEPLKATVPVRHFSADQVQDDIKIKLASLEEYERMGLNYPAGINFRLDFQKNQGEPYIDVWTTEAVELPFVDLLISFNSGVGRITKSFTFLLDPAPGITAPVVSAPPDSGSYQVEDMVFDGGSVEAQAYAPSVEADIPAQGRFIFNKGQASYTEAPRPPEPVKPKAKPKPKRSTQATTAQVSNIVSPFNAADYQPPSSRPAYQPEPEDVDRVNYGRMSMALSTSLSISRSDPGRLNSADALQEEIIVKEKILADMNSQVLELQSAVDTLKDRMSSLPADNANPAAFADPLPQTEQQPVERVVTADTDFVDLPPDVAADPLFNQPAGATDYAAGDEFNPDQMAPQAADPGIEVLPALETPVIEPGIASDQPQDVMPDPAMLADQSTAAPASTSIVDTVLGYFWWLVGLLMLVIAGAVGLMLYRKRKQANDDAEEAFAAQQIQQAKSGAGSNNELAIPPLDKNIEPHELELDEPKVPASVASADSRSDDSGLQDESLAVADSNSDVFATPRTKAPETVEFETAGGGAAGQSQQEQEEAKRRAEEEQHFLQMQAEAELAEQSAAKPADSGGIAFADNDNAPLEQPKIKIAQPGVKPAAPMGEENPEYDLLEEADIYLRFGHNKLAEEVLREAINMNPANPQGYLTLLGIFEMRSDVKEFSKFASKLKELGDDDSWQQAAEMGRKIDPSNPMYGV